MSDRTEGDPARADESRRPEDLLPLVYAEIRKMAALHLSAERPDHTLQPTALVNEVYLKLAAPARASFRDRAHFLAVAANAMRQILIDHARRRGTAKRGGGWERITFDESLSPDAAKEADLEAVDAAIAKLESVDPEAARIVVLRFFGGMTEIEIAREMGFSERWVRLRWAHARSWLQRELQNSDEG